MAQCGMWVVAKKGEERQYLEMSGMVPIFIGGVKKIIPQEKVVVRPSSLVYDSLLGLACDVIHSGHRLEEYSVALVVAEFNRFTQVITGRVPTPRYENERVDLTVYSVRQGENIESDSGFVSLDAALLAWCPKETIG